MDCWDYSQLFGEVGVFSKAANDCSSPRAAAPRLLGEVGEDLGEVEFVASAKDREEVRGEVKDQDLHASEESRKAMGQEIGADFMLQGSINSIVDAVSGEQARFYQIDLTLIELGTNRKVWVGQKKIKKCCNHLPPTRFIDN